jgi:hypothetical protein
MAVADMVIIMNAYDDWFEHGIAITDERIIEQRDHLWTRQGSFTVSMPVDAFEYFSREYIPHFNEARARSAS